jgi:hypothetical protein
MKPREGGASGIKLEAKLVIVKKENRTERD